MKTKILPTLFFVMMSLFSISIINADPMRMRIESKEMREDLERAIEEQFYEELEWKPADEGEVRSESSAYYPYDYSQKTIENVGYQGNTIALDDGSVWVPKPNEGYRAQCWHSAYQRSGLPPAKVYITTNESWFYHRDYKYVMVNRETGESLPVMMVHGARLDRMIQIARIYYDVGKIELTDQHGNFVMMTMDRSDLNVADHWLEGERIFIGRNSKWSLSNSQYILINLDSNILHNSNMSHIRAAM